VSFTDLDPVFNHYLNEWEDKQFRAIDKSEPVLLGKTEEQGELYHEIRLGDQLVRLPRPFLFAAAPLRDDPTAPPSHRVARAICFYDNAGESFEPGKDAVDNPVTQHLSRAKAILFLFDPLQEPRFRKACKDSGIDLGQLAMTAVDTRQDVILREAARRLKRYKGMAEAEKVRTPLLVIITKWDIWKGLSSSFDIERLPILEDKVNGTYWLNGSLIARVSAVLRALLNRLCPELVAAAESFSSSVYYIPVSATGCAPEVSADGTRRGFVPSKINPMWVEIPLLLLLAALDVPLVRLATATQQNDKASVGERTKQEKGAR
jgi:hypothetical protein